MRFLTNSTHVLLTDRYACRILSLLSSREHNGERRKEENACAKTVSGGCAIAVAPSRLSFRSYRNPPPETIISHCTMHAHLLLLLLLWFLARGKIYVVISSCSLLTLLVDIFRYYGTHSIVISYSAIYSVAELDSIDIMIS